jgi:hypothetical protein
LDKSCTENQSTHFIFNNFFQKIVSFMRQFGKYGTARQGTYCSITRRMHFAFWTTKTKKVHMQNISHLLLSHSDNGYGYAPQSCVI